MSTATREELIVDLTIKGVVVDGKLTWANLCKFTKFDSFVTALAFGLNWKITDVNEIPIGHLQMAHFNVLTFPKDIQMKKELLALTILEQYRELLLNQSCLEYEELEKAIKQLKDLEHYSHYTSGLWCTDRPDLLSDDFKKDYTWHINFWDDNNE